MKQKHCQITVQISEIVFVSKILKVMFYLQLKKKYIWIIEISTYFLISFHIIVYVTSLKVFKLDNVLSELIFDRKNCFIKLVETVENFFITWFV